MQRDRDNQGAAAQRAYTALHGEIVRVERAPGSRLSEVTIAAALQMSRTPVREALRRLQADGLVDLEEGQTAVVAPITEDRIVEQYQVREALETYAFTLLARSPRRQELEPIADELAAVLAAARYDRDELLPFVDRIFAVVHGATGNGLLVDLVARMRTHARRSHALSPHPELRFKEAAEQYLSLLHAVIDQDEAMIAVHVHERLETAMRSALDNIRSHGPTLLDPEGAARLPAASSA